MGLYVFYLLVKGFALFACTMLLLWITWILIMRFHNKRIMNNRYSPGSSEELEDFARNSAAGQSISNRRNLLNWPIPRMNDNYDVILSTYRQLNENVKKKLSVSDTAQWLLDNFYIIEEHVKVIRRDTRRNSFLRLPVLTSGSLKGFARIFAIAMDIVSFTDGQIDDAVLVGYLNAYQTKCPLYDREIVAVSTYVRLALIERIRQLCKNIRETLSRWQEADRLVDEWLKKKGQDAEKAIRQHMNSLKTMDKVNPRFIERLFYRLRRSGRGYAAVQRIVDEHLAKLGTDTAQIIQKEHSAQSKDTVLMSNCITSLRYLNTMDWSVLYEATSFVEEILNKDPDGTYPRMDSTTRNYYRSRVEALAEACGTSGFEIAMGSVRLAEMARRGAQQNNEDETQWRRRGHIGYYLIDKGRKLLCEQVGQKKIKAKAEDIVKSHPGAFYFGAIGLIVSFLVATAVAYAYLTPSEHALLLCIIAGVCVVLPALEIAVHGANFIVCKTVKPAVFPKMEFRDGIPQDLGAVVAVPTLLGDEKTVLENLKNLEGQYLRNREDNLYFALIGAFRDADNSTPNDDKKIIDTAMKTVYELNQKYAKNREDIFYFFHRRSLYNQNNNKWFGWERKRGALMEFNEMILGSKQTSFAYFSNGAPPFSNIKYVITLDSDTILPMGMAKKMVETMAHPLNRPIVDQKRGIVVDGYGILQPRIHVNSESVNKTLFSRIFADYEGLDPYAHAISDVYQDLFGEGIYTGKGIYDIHAFQAVLKDAIPDNTILSHDLLEGSYVRTGLVTNLALIDSYPTHYHAFSARLHRWVRGDWQLFPFLFYKIYDRNRRRIQNPLNALSKWKILDNMRRSLISPAMMALLMLSFCVLPGSLCFWLSFFFLTIVFPFLVAVFEYVSKQRYASDRIKRHIPVIVGLKAALFQGVFSFILLPYQAYLMIHAILVTLIRLIVTKKNMLEWITSADVEKSKSNTVKYYWQRMWVSAAMALVIVAAAFAFKPETTIISLIFLPFWACAPQIAYWISRTKEDPPLRLSQNDIRELRKIARRTWRYFEEFLSAWNHYLPPDNYQVDPPRGVAHRTSPTNIGLGLLSVLSARDFGYIGTGRMAELVKQTLTTVTSMEKWNGHLYNWYDTHTKKPLGPRYVSTVDSGNLIGYLITLREGLKEYMSKPLVDGRLIDGLADTLRCDGKDGIEIWNKSGISHEGINSQSYDLIFWYRIISSFSDENAFHGMRQSVWKEKTTRMAKLFLREMNRYLPGIRMLVSMPEQLKNNAKASVACAADALADLLIENVALEDLPKHYADILTRIDGLVQSLQEGGDGKNSDEIEWLANLQKALEYAAGTVNRLIENIGELIGQINALCDATKFRPLYMEQKKLFSIGYNAEENKLTNAYYDLLASESRQSSYIGISRGEIPPEHWTRMSRALASADGYKGLISWTGTMFEYLMPLLIMKNYKNTLLDESYAFVIRNQIKHGRQKATPWGVSESGYYLLDRNHDYQYKAFGVPWLGLKRGLAEDVVIAPYATFLALLVEPREAVTNIARLVREGLAGPYGFYEAADYTAKRLPYETKRAVIKSYMAHHQGMSLMALNNCLHQNILQERFHRDAQINAARLLLQEKIPSKLLFTKEAKERAVPFAGPVTKELWPVRKFGRPDPVLPMAHILSNGNYSIMITDRGTGYSRTRMAAVNRWRADSTLDPYGMFFYVRNLNTDAVWCTAYSPINQMPDEYEVIFSADKALFKRADGSVKTTMEVTVADEDSVEIRRISLKNVGDTPCDLEVTSYFEIVLASQASDVAHPAFGNLFVETSFIQDMKCLVASRRPRSELDEGLWMANAAVIEGKILEDIQFETDRMQMLGRGRTAKNPAATERKTPLSNTAGSVLDPVMSLRSKLRIMPGKTARISFVVAVSESYEQLLSLVEKYADAESVENVFRLALTRSRVEAGYLNLEAKELELYQNMIRDIIYISPLRKQHQDMIRQNKKGQSSLWRFGISGDVPVVLVNLKNANRLDLLSEILKAHEYWRLKNIMVDIVILCEDEYSYALPLFSRVCDIVFSRRTHDIIKMSDDVFILDRSKLSMEEEQLLYAAASIVLWGDGPGMAEQMRIGRYEVLPKIRQYEKRAQSWEPIDTDRHELLFDNGLGGFGANGDEYVIRLEHGQNTPAPWVNVIANERFGFIVSESGSLCTFGSNSHESRLTPWSNDAVSDSPAEALYLSDLDTGECWTTTALPIREGGPYTIRHGFGYSVFERFSHGIQHTLTQYVPVNDTVKISLIRLKNDSGQIRRLSLTYYIQPVLGASEQVTAKHIHTGVNDSGSLLIENHYNEEFGGKVCFIDSSVPERTVTGNRREFFGSGGMDAPDCLKREGLSGTVGTGFDPCAAMQINVTLDPAKSVELVFLLGSADDYAGLKEVASRYRNVQSAKDAFVEVRQFWRDKLCAVRVDTPSKPMNLMLNGWLLYQVISCRMWARSGFYQSGGAYGFRDQLQDCLAAAHMWPKMTKAQIIRHARHQFLEGDVLHWWHEPHEKGTRTRISDDRLWLPYAVTEYIRITADKRVLDEMIPYLTGDLLREYEDERYMTPCVSNGSGSLYDHCIRAIDRSLCFGAHGLPLMGSGDWNDGMNAVGNGGSGESVWLGWFLIDVLDRFIPLCTQEGDSDRANRYAETRKKLHEAIEKNAWDGNWYLRAFFDDGTPLGCSQNTNCKIDSIAQSWAVLSGAGDPQRAQKAMNSLLEYLVLREEGLIKLLAPPFDKGDLEPGYIKGYVPGIRENGGQYTHAAAWSVIAFAMMGNGEEAFELFNLVNPINHATNLRECFRYKVEPYVIAADVYTLQPHIGRGGWTWYTGSAGWMYRAGLEHILGFQKNGDTVIINPCIPKQWREYSIGYRYLDTTYSIRVINPDGLNKGVRKITLDGRTIPGNTIELINDGKVHSVLAVLEAEGECVDRSESWNTIEPETQRRV